MKYFKCISLLFLILASCKTNTKQQDEIVSSEVVSKNFIIAFGSCNNQEIPNLLWKEIEKNKPNVWIWGGDIIYSDTEDMGLMAQDYQKQKTKSDYANFIKNIDVLATWDDHDYGLNDGGKEYSKKAESQDLFLDFIDVEKDDNRRQQEGVYFAKDYKVNEGIIKIILLDTRYFRTALTQDTITKKRYKPNVYGEGSMLGDVQWEWLTNQLQNSKASFNIIVSSIQFLSSEHGYESWRNMTHEVDKLENLIKTTNAKNTIILSGDRHLSEFSKKKMDSLAYPLIDFTSSGMTHSYSSFQGEPNKFRVGEVVFQKSFGILKFNFKTKTVTMQMRGENNTLQQEFIQSY
ncbi:alkaline phosphatase family protein [Flavobacteriaceae bacterium AH-315-B10]|nr:alkaline phosphatase family protein [Flavobacteriaceae bacterium AH-315-B10]